MSPLLKLLLTLAIATFIISILYIVYDKFVKTTKNNDPVDCQVSGWMYDKCICEESKNTGTVTKRRTIITNSKNGGKQCPSLTSSEDCVCKSSPTNSPTNPPVDDNSQSLCCFRRCASKPILERSLCADDCNNNPSKYKC